MSASSIFMGLLLIIYYWIESIILAFVPKRLRFKSIKGHNVLITGGGSGIGRLLALRFAEHGAQIIIWDINLDGALETVKMVKEKGGKGFAFHCDISLPQNVYATAAKTKAEVGKVDILVNNAGIVTGKKLLDCPDMMIKKTFEVNAMAHFWTCKAFLPEMMAENKGHLVSVASLAGLYGMVQLTDYCASKYAAVGFEESIRLELHADGYTGIHSTVVCPFFINTGMFDGCTSGVFTVLTPEYVADEIVAAVLINQEVLVIPKVFNVLLTFKAILPPKSTCASLFLTETFASMREFIGRQMLANGARRSSNESTNHCDDAKIKCL